MKTTNTGRQQGRKTMNLTGLEWMEFCIDALKEDAADRDVTSELLIEEDLKATAEIICEGNGILCGINAAKHALKFWTAASISRSFVLTAKK